MNIKSKGKVLINLVIIISLLFLGCTTLDQAKREKVEKTGLAIYSMSTGLGAISNDNSDQHRLTYAISLTNEDEDNIYIQWMEPILGKGIKDKVITKKLQVAVGKTISAKGSLEIEGEFVFDTQNLSKEEIINLEPFITGIKVGNEKVIIINAQLQ